MRGTVTAYDAYFGVGAIEPADGGDPVPVHIGAIERSGLPSLLVGQEVEFTRAAGMGAETFRAVDIVIR